MTADVIRREGGELSVEGSITIDNVVSVYRPFCLMAIVPGSISSQADPQTGRGTVSFQAIEARDL